MLLNLVTPASAAAHSSASGCNLARKIGVFHHHRVDRIAVGSHRIFRERRPFPGLYPHQIGVRRFADLDRHSHARPIIEKVVDQGSFMEMGKLFGRSVVTGLARVDGWPVALMASDPMFYGGGWTADTCQKVARFVDMAETFHLPLVYFCDCPGFLIGLEAEKSGVIRHGVRAMSAMFQGTVPWCTFIIRNAFGVAGAAHQNGGRLTWRYAWPSGRWGSLPLEGGIEAAYRADLDAAPDRKEKMAEIEERLNKLRSPFRSAESFWIEEIIDPRDTRKILCEFVEMAAPIRGSGKANFWMRP